MMKKYNVEIGWLSTFKIALGIFMALVAVRMTEKKPAPQKNLISKASLDSVKVELDKLYILTDSLAKVKQQVIVVEAKEKKKSKRKRDIVEQVDTLSKQ
jgi:hypothetical protein